MVFMDVLAFIDNRLTFIQWFYDRAADPFDDMKRKIEAHEEPYAFRYEPGHYDGFEYEEEWSEADDGLRVLGHCALGLVEKALHDYLREVVLELDRSFKKASGSWFEGFCRFLEANTAFDWLHSPVPFERLEQINLSRNDVSHDSRIHTVSRPQQSTKHFRKHPISLFAEEGEIAMFAGDDGKPEFPLTINVTREKLLTVIEDVRQFCRFVHSVRTT